MTPPKISIVIPHRRGAVLLDCLRSIQRFTEGNTAEVLVVQDGSPDPSFSNASHEFSHYRFIQGTNEKPRGFAATCNVGARHSKGSYLLFLNNDAVVTPQWLSPLIDAMERFPNLAACGPKILSLRKEGYFSYCGGAGGKMDIFGFPFTRGRIAGTVEQDSGQYDTGQRVFWISGCAMIVRRNIFERLGMFDETFFMQMEEVDFCWRAQIHGYQVQVIPSSTVYHYGGYTLSETSLFKCFLNHRNNLITLLKNYSWKTLLWAFPCRVLLQLAAVLYSLLKPTEWKHGVSSLAALIWIAAHPLLVMKKHFATQKMRSRSDREIRANMFEGSIPVSYVLGGIRSFSSLSEREKRAPSPIILESQGHRASP